MASSNWYRECSRCKGKEEPGCDLCNGTGKVYNITSPGPNANGDLFPEKYVPMKPCRNCDGKGYKDVQDLGNPRLARIICGICRGKRLVPASDSSDVPIHVGHKGPRDYNPVRNPTLDSNTRRLIEHEFRNAIKEAQEALNKETDETVLITNARSARDNGVYRVVPTCEEVEKAFKNLGSIRKIDVGPFIKVDETRNGDDYHWYVRLRMATTDGPFEMVGTLEWKLREIHVECSECGDHGNWTWCPTCAEKKQDDYHCSACSCPHLREILREAGHRYLKKAKGKAKGKNHCSVCGEIECMCLSTLPQSHGSPTAKDLEDFRDYARNVSFGSVYSERDHLISKDRDPTPNDVEYDLGSLWLNRSTNEIFIYKGIGIWDREWNNSW